MKIIDLKLKKYIIFVIFFGVFFFTHASTNTSSITFSFTLNQSARTSAGIYDNSGVLLRTLWSGVTYGAGSHSAVWDGTDDQGRLIPDGSYIARVLSDNVNYQWEGVVGNTSAASSGQNIYHGNEDISDIAFTSTTGYFATDYNEAGAAVGKFTITNPQSPSPLLANAVSANTGFAATDGTTVYFDAQDPFNKSNSFIFATQASDDSQIVFANGTPVTLTHGTQYESGIDVGTQSNATVTGLAVQKTGTYLFASHGALNQVDVLDKTTGALIQTLSITAPGSLAIDSSDNLWMITGTTVAKYTVNTDGTLSTAAVTLAGLVDPISVAVSPDGATVAVADGGNSQQVKAFSTTDGTATWTLGQAGGYATDPTVANDKFFFADFSYDTTHTFISFAPDGTFWVGDPGNDRVQHFSTDQSFIDRIMYLPSFYSSRVDQNDSTRVFANYLEFAVDYSKALSPTNGSWTLVKNWGYGIPSQYDDNYTRLYDVTTLSNNRTYAFLLDHSQGSKPLAMVELTTSGLRFTGYETPNLHYEMYPDGSLRWVTGATLGNAMVWNEMPLTGFDNLNNPIWDSPVVLGSSPTTTSLDPVIRGSDTGTYSIPTTSNNVLVAFDAGLPLNGVGSSGYHLGGIQAGTNTWLWRTAPSTYTGYQGVFPKDGTYDIGNNVQYAGSKAMSVGRNIIWGYHGEFWKGTETNKYNHVYDDGLFVGQFGVAGSEVSHTSNFNDETDVAAQMAGNSFSDSLITGTDGNVYMYTNDETYHGGIHRWKITGLDTIVEQNIPITLLSPSGGLLGQYYDGTQINNAHLQTTRIEPTVNLTANPTNTTLSDSSNFSVRFTGFVKPAYTETYTFYTQTNSGIRVWVDNTLLIDHWNNTSSTEFSGSIDLQAATAYPIRVEYTNNTTASLSLSWSSTSQQKQIIPSTNFYSSSAPDTSNGIDLMDGLPFNSSLADSQYGWTRTPTTDDTTDIHAQYWSANIGSMSENALQPQDVQGYFIQPSGNYSISRDLGTHTGVSSWTLSGDVTFQRNQDNAFGQASYIDVLDSTNKIISRFNTAQEPRVGNDPVVLTVYGNGTSILQDTSGAIKNSVLSQTQPFTIHATNNAVTFSYGTYTPITTGIFDQQSNWQNPTTMRMYFSGGGGNPPYSHTIDLAHVHFLATTPTATTFTITGPISGSVNVASTNFTITPDNPYTGTITITPSGGGLSTPIVLTFSNSSSPQTFTITPTAQGTVTLVSTNDGSLTNPANISYESNDVSAPVITSNTPTTFASWTTSATLSIDTNETATCKYATTPNTSYGSMTLFTTTGSTTHSTQVSGLSNGSTYTYYTRCADTFNNTNQTDTIVTFTITMPIVSGGGGGGGYSYTPPSATTTPPTPTTTKSTTDGSTSPTINTTTGCTTSTQFSIQTGALCPNYIKPTKSTPAKNTSTTTSLKTAIVTSIALNIRSVPTTGNVVASVKKGAVATVLSEPTDGWVKVAFTGLPEGYVSVKYIKIISPSKTIVIKKPAVKKTLPVKKPPVKKITTPRATAPVVTTPQVPLTPDQMTPEQKRQALLKMLQNILPK